MEKQELILLIKNNFPKEWEIKEDLKKQGVITHGDIWDSLKLSRMREGELLRLLNTLKREE